MTQYNFSDMNTNSSAIAIPPKTRTVKKSPLYARMEKMKIGEAFVVNDAQMASVAANIYATAKRIGIKVTLRQLEEGVGVWRVRNQQNASNNTNESQNEGSGQATGRKRLVKGNRGRKAA